MNRINSDLDRLFLYGEVWRIWTCQLPYETLGEALFSLGVLCPLMRRFEREMGSRKFASFLTFTFVIASTWELIFFQVFSTYNHTTTPRVSGPYPWLGSLLFLFHVYTPRLYPNFFSLLGIMCSEKSITYAIALQLIFSGGTSTMIPAATGMMAAFVCTTPALQIKNWELPSFVYRIGPIVGRPFMDTPNTPFPNINHMNNIPNARFPARDRNGNRMMAPPPPAAMIPPARQHQQARHRAPPTTLPIPTPPPSEEMIETLTSMGFERDAVLRVLQQCDNNVERAANQLLNA